MKYNAAKNVSLQDDFQTAAGLILLDKLLLICPEL
jgi:hypothetical protein